MEQNVDFKHLVKTAAGEQRRTFWRSPMLLIQSVMRLLFLAGSSTLATVLAAPLLTPACTASNPRLNGKAVRQGPQTALHPTLG